MNKFLIILTMIFSINAEIKASEVSAEFKNIHNSHREHSPGTISRTGRAPSTFMWPKSSKKGFTSKLPSLGLDKIKGSDS